MAKIAIVGFGTVGSGVLEVVRQNADVIEKKLGQRLEVKWICDVRDFSESPDEKLFTADFNEILADTEVEVVVETIGGTKPAYDFVSRALESGKSVVTSNKELVAAYGDVLLAKAKEKKVCFLFEASVGGGTPLIVPMTQSMATNHILGVSGIVNGTTNFMLTRMEENGMDFNSALQEAQSLGYAETIDPSSDTDGIDAGRKIAILAAIAYGKHVYPQNVSTRGIREIAQEDIKAAQQMDAAVKLIAWTNLDDNSALQIGVEPMLVKKSNLLASVKDVYNAVSVCGDLLGETVFYGPGAGKIATASAVVSDVIDALKTGVEMHDTLCWEVAEEMEGVYVDNGRYDFYLRPAFQEGVEVMLQQERVTLTADGKATVWQNYSAEEIDAVIDALDQDGVPVAAKLKILQ